jgi:hypothetical protein
MSLKLLGIISVGSVIIDLLPSDFICLPDAREKWEYNGAVCQLFIDFKKAYDSIKS